MPNGVYPVPKFRPTTDRHPSALRTRLQVWWHRRELDEELAAGAQPAAGTLLEQRAEQLGSRRGRAELSRALATTLAEAHKTRPNAEVGLQLRRGEIRSCDEDIFALIRRLDDVHPIDVQGAAMVSRLLSDSSGPLSRVGATSLRYELRSARLALDHADEPAFALHEAA
ncbi:MAG TPA: hypothetical protein VFX51_12940 [Solirubrobacteraceae bacterium]|nr:hypothetical protein [Solirubrobacteraceae bacterium]